MKLFWIIITLEICNVLCNDEIPKTVQDIIKTIFNYECEMGPKIGEIIFWNISSDQIVNSDLYLWENYTNEKQFRLQEYIQGITQFQTNETYMILTKDCNKIQTGNCRTYLYYWVGSQASLNDKKEAAKYTTLHYLLLKKYFEPTSTEVFMQRERESIESDLFQYTIISSRRVINNSLFKYYQESGTLSLYPHLYVIRGTEDTSRMKKVPVSNLWLKNDTCMVLEVGYIVDGWLPVHLHCGVHASAKSYNYAKYIASQLCSSYGMAFSEQLQIINNINQPQLKLFIELLEDKSYYRPNEVDNTNYHLLDVQTFINERDARISFSIIASNSETIVDDGSYVILECGLLKKDIFDRPITSAYAKANYILNTDSILGVVVRVGLSAKAGLLIMQYVEEYVHNIESNTSRPTPLHLD